MRRKGPRFNKVGADALMVSGRYVGQTQVLVDVGPDGGLDLSRLHVHPVVEKAV
jgi:hypothetical protein